MEKFTCFRFAFYGIQCKHLLTTWLIRKENMLFEILSNKSSIAKYCSNSKLLHITNSKIRKITYVIIHISETQYHYFIFNCTKHLKINIYIIHIITNKSLLFHFTQITEQKLNIH